MGTEKNYHSLRCYNAKKGNRRAIAKHSAGWFKVKAGKSRTEAGYALKKKLK